MMAPVMHHHESGPHRVVEIVRVVRGFLTTSHVVDAKLTFLVPKHDAPAA
jgi:hypothetical protein